MGCMKDEITYLTYMSILWNRFIRKFNDLIGLIRIFIFPYLPHAVHG